MLGQLVKAFQSDNISIAEKLLSGLASLAAMGAVLWISDYFLGKEGLPLVVASMGATAVLLFAVPQGPLSQPWPLIGGHFISAFIGVTCAQQLHDPLIAGALAVGLSISVMYFCQCLHPPGGATALTAVWGGPAVHQLGYGFLFTPLALNVAVMFAIALILNNILPRRRYPASLRKRTQPIPGSKSDVRRQGLESALQKMGTFIDISVEELEQIYSLAKQSQQQLMGQATCADIMTPNVITADYDTPVEQVWEWMIRHRIRGVPVVDRKNFVIGMVTTRDFLKQVLKMQGKTWNERIKRFLTATPGLETNKPEVAGHIMSRPAITIEQDKPVADIIPLLAKHGIHHIPVVDHDQKIVGIISEHDLIKLLDLSPADLSSQPR